MPRRLNADAGLERKMARNAFDAYFTAVIFFVVKVQRSEKNLTENPSGSCEMHPAALTNWIHCIDPVVRHPRHDRGRPQQGVRLAVGA